MLNVHNLTIAALCSKEASRFTLNGIGVFPPKPGTFAGAHGATVVTDGHLLLAVERPDQSADSFPEPENGSYKLRRNGTEDKQTFVVPAESALACAKALPTRTTIPILSCAAVAGPDGARELITNDLETVKRFPAEGAGNFPDVERVMVKKEDCDYAITFDANLLAKLLTQIARMGRRGNSKNQSKAVATTLYLKKPKKGYGAGLSWDSVMLEAYTEDMQRVTGLLSPMRGDADEFMKSKVQGESK